MAQTKHTEMDMLPGGLAGKLILFALPLAFSSILQQLFNSADVAVVGRFAGDTALAAVGSCVALVGIFVNLIVGLSVGPNAVLALLIGQNNREEINRTLHTVITFGAALGVVFTEILSAVFMIWDDFFVSIYTTSSAVAAFAISRMRHVCSLEGLTATYEVESAALRGMGKSLEPAIFTVLGTVVFRLIWMATIFRLVPTFEMLMDVYVASWVFTGGALLIVYLRHMRKVSHT